MGKRTLILALKMDREIIALVFAVLLSGSLIVALMPGSAGIGVCAMGRHILSGFSVAIDPGHGGIDGGAHDKKGLMEKNINLDVSLKLKGYLEEMNARVIMTRERDTSLEDKSDLNSSRYRRDLDGRKDIINGSNADVFVSIHVNSSPGYPATRGAIVFYNPASEYGKLLAGKIARSIDSIAYKDYLKSDTLKTKVRSDDYYILRETKVVGVIVELGFLTNQYDKALLQDKRFKEKIASAIAEGIALYLTSY